MVLINTEKGKYIFERLSMEVRLSVLSDVMPLNGGFKECRKPHPKRAFFFQRFAAGEAVNSIVKDLLHVPLWQRVVRWIERMLKCFLHKSRIKKT